MSLTKLSRAQVFFFTFYNKKENIKGLLTL